MWSRVSSTHLRSSQPISINIIFPSLSRSSEVCICQEESPPKFGTLCIVSTYLAHHRPLAFTTLTIRAEFHKSLNSSSYNIEWRLKYNPYYNYIYQHPEDEGRMEEPSREKKKLQEVTNFCTGQFWVSSIEFTRIISMCLTQARLRAVLPAGGWEP
jgi:hypothetical protein